MSDLVPVHGGLSQPVNKTVSADQVEAFKKEMEGLPKVPVSAADLSSIYRIADGTLSPLTGPMGKAAYDLVLDEMVVMSNGKKYAWSIPISFPVTSELAAQLKPGQKVALTTPEGEAVATLEISDIFEWDKPRYIKSVYGTERTDHAGANMVLTGDAADKTHLIGGELMALPQPKNPAFGKYVLSPVETRALVAQ